MNVLACAAARYDACAIPYYALAAQEVVMREEKVHDTPKPVDKSWAVWALRSYAARAAGTNQGDRAAGENPSRRIRLRQIIQESLG